MGSVFTLAATSFLMAPSVNLRFFLTTTSPVRGSLMSRVARWPLSRSGTTSRSYLPLPSTRMVSVS